MRLIGSFRARIFALSALIVVAVLAAVVALGWSRVLGYEVQRLDERLCGELRRLLTLQPPRSPAALARLEDDLLPKLRLKGPEQLLWRLERGAPGGVADDGLRLGTADWPAGLDTAALAWRRADGGPGRPRREAGPGADRDPDRAPGPSPDRLGGPPARFDGPPPDSLADGPPGRRRGGPPPVACEVAPLALRGADWRAARAEAPWGRAFIAADLAATRAEMRDALQGAAGLALPLALGLTAAGAWLLASLALRPVTRLREAMKAVDAGALDRRLPSAGEDREFRALIASYNTMLERLEASFHQASRFSADAAHELKTPLTILRGQLERAIQASEHHAIQAQLGGMLDEVARLSSITRKLLLLSQADAGRLPLLRQPVDLGGLLGDCVADAQMAWPAVSLQLDLPAAPANALQVPGDPQLLAQLLNNLCGNAMKYSPSGGGVRIATRALPESVEVRIENRAPGLRPADRARFFERFHRGDAAHGRQTDGHGLGLSLAREIARAHGGELLLEPAAPGDDRVVLSLRLPRHRPRRSPTDKRLPDA